MSNDLHDLPSTRLDVSSLIDRPGASRQADIDVPVPDGFSVPLTTFAGPVSIEGVLEALVDGVLLRGILSVQATQQCASCLEQIAPVTITSDVAELYSESSAAAEDDVVEPGYQINDALIDVEALVRDSLAESTPAAPKCDADCAGLCPTCGCNLNHKSCDCADDDVDDRWSALSNLNLNP
ncbi:YceD family protein [soil metagenome]|jgi:uncharacterized protein